MCKVNMLGYQIEVDYGAHVKERLRSRFDDVDIAFLEYRIEAVFSDEAVADHLIHKNNGAHKKSAMTVKLNNMA